jgi:outer membrane protein, adhesin transport system
MTIVPTPVAPPLPLRRGCGWISPFAGVAASLAVLGAVMTLGTIPRPALAQSQAGPPTAAPGARREGTPRAAPRPRATPAPAQPPAVPVAPTASNRCPDDEPLEAARDPVNPRADLKAMVDEALVRSQAVGASRLLAEAAALDVEEARAAVKPTAAITLNAGVVANQTAGLPDTRGGQARAGVTVSGPLYDGGRIGEITGWRRHLAEAARQGQLSAQEQVALQTVSLALERNRYRLQTQVYRQYARKMACLVESLEVIVARDRGRQSELVQAQKTQAQAELARAQALSSLRQTEARLRRFAGDGLPPSEGLSVLMLGVPALPDVLATAEAAPEIAQLRAQADAQDSLTRAVAAAAKPQLNWVVSGSKATGAGNPGNLSAGVALSIPLFTPGVAEATEASRRRAEAARLQTADLITERRSRVAEVHEQATAAFDRARRVTEVLRDSDRVRSSTLQQWQQLGRRSLFDVMAAEGEHYNLRIAYVNALADGQQSTALLSSLAGGVKATLD